MKSMLSTILRETLILQLLYHGRLCLLIAFDRFYNYARKCNVFKQSVYLNIYFFFLSRHFARAKCWGISVKHCEFTEVFILRCLMITCRNKTSKGLCFKIDVWPHTSLPAALSLPKMFNSIIKAFFNILRVSEIVSLKSWLHFGFGIKTKRGLSPSTYATTELTFEQPCSCLWKS